MTYALDELNNLLSFCKYQAKLMLEKNKGFEPFGSYLSEDSEEVKLLVAYDSPDLASAQQKYAFIESALGVLAANKEAWAIAIASHIDIPLEITASSRSGIRVHISAPGYSRQIITPYRIAKHPIVRKLMGLPLIEYLEPILID